MVAGYFFLAMGCVSIIKALQYTLFLKNVGVNWRLPLLYMISAALSVPIVLLYRVLAHRLSQLALSSATLCVFILTLAGAWRLLQEHIYWANFAFFLWAGLFALLLPTLGWVVAYGLFTAREGKRVFGLLGMGGIVGGAAGGYWTFAWSDPAYTGKLVGEVLGALLLLQIVLVVIHRSGRHRDRHGGRPTSGSSGDRGGLSGDTRSSAKGLLASGYLRWIAALVFISGLATTVIDLHYVWFLRHHLASSQDLTRFISGVLGSMFLVSGFFQLLGTGRLLNRFGIPVALLILPAGLVSGSALAAAVPGFAPAVTLKAIDGSLRTSLHRTAVEILYVPVAGQGAVSIKSLVDLVIFRLGDAAGALVFLIGLAVTGSSVRVIPVLILVAALVWAFLAWRTAGAYIENLRLSVHQAAVGRRRLQLQDFRSADLVAEQLREASGWRLRVALDQLATFSENERRLPAVRPVVVEEMLESHISGLYRGTPPWFPMVSGLVSHPDPNTGAAAFRLLVRFDPRSYQRKLKKELQGDEVPETVYLVYLARYGDQPERVVEPVRALRWSRKVRGVPGGALARIMGRTVDPAYLPVLSDWLHSPDPELRRGAVEAIGHFADSRYWDTLVSLLRAGSTRQAARMGLANYGAGAIDRLTTLLKNPDVDLAVKREVPLILGQIPTSAARAALIVALFWPDSVVSYRALKVLNKTRAYRELSYLEASFVPVLMQWARQYYEACNLESVIPTSPQAGGGASGSPGADSRAWRLLLKVVKERQGWSVEKIFRTLDLFLPRGEGYLSYLAMGDRTLVRDNAIELIELRLKGEVKNVLIPIFGEKDPKEQMKIGRRLFGLPVDRNEIIRDGLFDPDPLVKSSVLAVVGHEGLKGLLEEVKNAKQDPNRLVRETAELVFRNLTGE